MALKHTAVLKLQKQFVCIATHFLVTSPYSRDFVDVIFNYNGYNSSLTYECLVFR